MYCIHLWKFVDGILTDMSLALTHSVEVFSRSFQDSCFVCQKCTSIYTGGMALKLRGFITVIQCIIERIHIFSVCKGLNFISFAVAENLVYL